jgi:hypothetical protein
LATTDDARVHCAVLKVRAVPVLRRSAAGRCRSCPRRPSSCDRALRTQQRARPAHPPGPAFRAADSVLRH